MPSPIITAISKPEVAADSAKLLGLLAGVKAQLANNSLDISEVMSPLVKLVATNNSAVKAQVCDLVILAAGKEPDVGLLVVNILNKDVQDPNPQVRGTAITTICSLPVLLPYAQTAILSGLQDSDPAVRVSAVTGAGKVWRHSPGEAKGLGLVDRLYQVLRDSEPSVITFAIQTLNVILAKEGGIVINSNMVRYFLSRLSDFKEKELCFLLDFLAISNMSDELRLSLLNTLDPYLDLRDATVVLCVVKVLIKLVSNHSSLKSSLVTRILPIFTVFLKSSSYREFNVNLILFMGTLDRDYLQCFQDNFKLFFLKSKDTEDLRIKKIEFLPRLANEDNLIEIVNYLFNMLPQTESMNSLIVKSVLDICVQHRSCFLHVLGNLQLLLKADGDQYLRDILNHVELLNLEDNFKVDREKTISFVQTLFESLDSSKVLDPSLVSNIIPLLENFSEHLPDSVYLLEDILDMEDNWPPSLYLTLLSCSYNMFLLHPASMQHLLVRTFHVVKGQRNHQLHQNLAAYYQLLRNLGETG